MFEEIENPPTPLPRQYTKSKADSIFVQLYSKDII